MKSLTRRRFLTISAAAVTLTGAPREGAAATWRGTALGARAQMQIAGLSAEEAEPIFQRVAAEVTRLEDIFSLYRPASALSRLNATGDLPAPPPEMLELLSLVSSVNAATGSAFDPSVQPLWRAYAEAAGPQRIAAARALIGWEGVEIAATGVRFRRKGMALTLNGIAQGYVADRVAAMLRDAGLVDVLVDMGEINALGQRPGGGAWQVGIVAPGETHPAARIGLSDRAIATSAPLGSRLRVDGPGHIIDPRTGVPGGRWSLVSVSAGQAALADGLSTAFCIMERDEIGRTLDLFAGARIEYLG